MYKKPKKIPTILGLFLLFAVMASTIYIDRQSQSITSKAQTAFEIDYLALTNITASSFTVSWLTTEPTTGFVKLEKGPTTGVFLDDLDTDNRSRPRLTHHVTITGLSSNTKYTAKIINGDGNCQKSAHCIEVNQKTAAKITSYFKLPPLRGKVVDKSNKPATDAVIYATIAKSSPLSTRVDSSGLWVIPLNNLYSQELLTRPDIKQSDLIQIDAKVSPTENSFAVVDIGSIEDNLTLPDMIIGESYNFVGLKDKIDILAQLRSEKALLGLQTTVAPDNISSQTTSQNTLNLYFPRQDGDYTTDPKPRIRGSFIPGSKLTITLESSPQKQTITVPETGIWTFRPVKPLSAGVHTLTIEGVNDNGNPVYLQRRFIVLKSGEQVLGEATPSASLTPSPQATITATLTPEPQLPTLTPSPTQIPESTASPPEDITVTPTSVVTPPRSGSLQPVSILLGGSVALIVLGLKLLLL